jgi:hypothetical protein
MSGEVVSHKTIEQKSKALEKIFMHEFTYEFNRHDDCLDFFKIMGAQNVKNSYDNYVDFHVKNRLPFTTLTELSNVVASTLAATKSLFDIIGECESKK